jgi:hypothetical protein
MPVTLPKAGDSMTLMNVDTEDTLDVLVVYVHDTTNENSGCIGNIAVEFPSNGRTEIMALTVAYNHNDELTYYQNFDCEHVAWVKVID